MSTDASATEALIEAVLADQPTEGGPEFTAGPHGSTRVMSRVGTIVATAAGKVALCTAVAAASVAGVYVTTDRIGGPAVPAVPAVPAGPAVPAEPAVPHGPDVPGTTGVPDAPNPPQRPETESAGRDANDHGREVADLAPGTARDGCERGQAISELASAGADDHRDNPDPKVNPCVRSDERGPAAAGSEAENRGNQDVHRPDGPDPGSDRADGAPGAGPSGDTPHAGDNGTPGSPGGPEDRGRPADAGKPDRSDRDN